MEDREREATKGRGKTTASQTDRKKRVGDMERRQKGNKILKNPLLHRVFLQFLRGGDHWESEQVGEREADNSQQGQPTEKERGN